MCPLHSNKCPEDTTKVDSSAIGFFNPRSMDLFEQKLFTNMLKMHKVCWWNKNQCPLYPAGRGILTVDGRHPKQPPGMYKTAVNNGILTTYAGFLPSTVYFKVGGKWPQFWEDSIAVRFRHFQHRVYCPPPSWGVRVIVRVVRREKGRRFGVTNHIMKKNLGGFK